MRREHEKRYSSRLNIDRSREIRLWIDTVIRAVGTFIGADAVAKASTGKSLLQIGKDILSSVINTKEE